MKRSMLIGVASLLVGCSIASVHATRLSRYVTVQPGLAAYQTHLLDQSMSLHFNANIVTVQQALGELLAFSGYRLINPESMGVYAQQMLKNPLPNAMRTVKHATLEQALIGVTGGYFYIVVDPVHRLISFKLKPEVKDIYLANHPMVSAHQKEQKHD